MSERPIAEIVAALRGEREGLIAFGVRTWYRTDYGDEAANRLADIDKHMRRIMACAESYESRIGVYGGFDIPEWIHAYTPAAVAARCEERPREAAARVAEERDEALREIARLRLSMQPVGQRIAGIPPWQGGRRLTRHPAP